MKKRITAAATISSRTTSGQNIPKITASTAAGIHPKANPKKPYVSVQNPHTPTNVAAARTCFQRQAGRRGAGGGLPGRAAGAEAEGGACRGAGQAIPYRRSPPPHVPRLSRGSGRGAGGLDFQVVARHVDRRHGQER